MRKYRSVIALILSTALHPAWAADAALGTAHVKLPIPAGYCELVEPTDHETLSTLSDLLNKSGNRLLVMSAECRQLADYRAGRRKRLDDFTQDQISLSNVDKPSTEPIKKTCAQLRAEGDKLLANQMKTLKPRIESTIKDIKMNETKFIGVLGEAPNQCYAGLIQKLGFDDKTEKTQVTVFDVSNVKERTLFIYRFTVYRSPETIDTTLKKLKADVAALFAANKR